MSEVERRDGGASLHLIEGGGRGGDRGGVRVARPGEDDGYYCWECENTESFIRLSKPVFHKEEVDRRGVVLKDLGHLLDAEADVEIRCARCNEDLTNVQGTPWA